MTIKTFKKRVITLLNDNHSYVLEGEALEVWKDQQKESAPKSDYNFFNSGRFSNFCCH